MVYSISLGLKFWIFIHFYRNICRFSRFGYKMCARIYLNGDGQGKGSHVSLFFVVMRSEYDALLTWPFPCKITMKLLGQDSNPNVVESFRPDPNSSSFRRPSSDMNIASGCPLFVSQSKIASGSYVKKDCIFVEVMVDTSSLPNFWNSSVTVCILLLASNSRSVQSYTNSKWLKHTYVAF